MKKLLLTFMVVLSCYALTNTVSAADQTPGDSTQDHAVATFAGGCFWCMEPPFDKLEGVISTISGYMGGHVDQPTYKQVSYGNSGHAEVLQVAYDPSIINYETLLKTFWKNIDPTDAGGQFCDRGRQYRTEVFYHDAEQRNLAEQSKAALVKKQAFESDIVTDITTASRFYPAEDYHQDYYHKNPIRYKYYRYACGRDERLERLWGK
jgi:peptide-methionine (S)-S-oxide reductase